MNRGHKKVAVAKTKTKVQAKQVKRTPRRSLRTTVSPLPSLLREQSLAALAQSPPLLKASVARMALVRKRPTSDPSQTLSSLHGPSQPPPPHPNDQTQRSDVDAKTANPPEFLKKSQSTHPSLNNNQSNLHSSFKYSHANDDGDDFIRESSHRHRKDKFIPENRFESQMNKFQNGHHQKKPHQFTPHANQDPEDLSSARSTPNPARGKKRQFDQDHDSPKHRSHSGAQFNNTSSKLPYTDTRAANYIRSHAKEFVANQAAESLLRSTSGMTDHRTKQAHEDASRRKKKVVDQMARDDSKWEQRQREKDAEDEDDFGRNNKAKFNPSLTQKQQRDRRLKEIKSIERKKKQILEQVNSFLSGSSKSRVSGGSYRTINSMLKTVNNSVSIGDIEAELGGRGNDQGGGAAQRTKNKALKPFVISWGKIGVEPYISTKLQGHTLQKSLSHNFSRSRIRHEQRRLRFIQERLYRILQGRADLVSLRLQAADYTDQNLPIPEHIQSQIDELLKMGLGDELESATANHPAIDENDGDESNQVLVMPQHKSSLPDDVLAQHNAKEIVQMMPITVDSFNKILDSLLSLRTNTPPHDSLYDTKDLITDSLVNADPTTKHLLKVYLKVKSYLKLGPQYSQQGDNDLLSDIDHDQDDNDDHSNPRSKNSNSLKTNTHKSKSKAKLTAATIPSVPELSRAQIESYTPSLALLPSALQLSVLPHMLPYKNKDANFLVTSPVSLHSFLHLKHKFETDPRELVAKVHDYPDDFLDTYEIHGTKEVGLEYLPSSQTTIDDATAPNLNDDGSAGNINNYHRSKDETTPSPTINGFHPLINANNYRRMTPAIPQHTYDIMFQHFDPNERLMSYLPGVIQSITTRPVLTPGQSNHNLGIKAIIVQPNREACVYAYNHIQTMLGAINQGQQTSIHKHYGGNTKQQDDKDPAKSSAKQSNKSKEQDNKDKGKNNQHIAQPIPYQFNAMRASGQIGHRTLARIQKSPPDILVLTPQALSQFLEKSAFGQETALEKLKFHRRAQRRQAQRVTDQKQIDDMDDDDLGGLARLVIAKGNITALHKLQSYGVTFDGETGQLRKMSSAEANEHSSKMTLQSLDRDEKLVLQIQNLAGSGGKKRMLAQLGQQGVNATTVSDNDDDHDDRDDDHHHHRGDRRNGIKRRRGANIDSLLEDDDGFDDYFDQLTQEHNVNNGNDDDNDGDDDDDEEFEVSNPHGDEDKKLQHSFVKKKQQQDSTEKQSQALFDRKVEEHMANDNDQEHLVGEAADHYLSLDKSQRTLFRTLHSTKTQSLDKQLESINTDLMSTFKLVATTTSDQTDPQTVPSDRGVSDQEQVSNAVDFDPIANNSLYTPKRVASSTTENLLLSHQTSSNGLSSTDEPQNQVALYRFNETDQEKEDLKRLYSLKNCSGDVKPLLFNLDWLVMDNADRLMNFHYNDMRNISLHMRYLRRLQGKYPSHDISRIAMACNTVTQPTLVVAATSMRDAVFVNGCYLDAQEGDEIENDEVAIETKSINSSVSHLVRNIDDATFSVKELMQYPTEALIKNRKHLQNDVVNKAKKLAPDLELDSRFESPLGNDSEEEENEGEESSDRSKPSSRRARDVAKRAHQKNQEDSARHQHENKQLKTIQSQSAQFDALGSLPNDNHYTSPDIQPGILSPTELDSAVGNAINSVHLLQQGTLVSPLVTHTYLMVSLPRRLKGLAVTLGSKSSNGLCLYSNSDFKSARFARKNKMIGFERLKTQLNMGKDQQWRSQRDGQHGDHNDEGSLETEPSQQTVEMLRTDDGAEIKFFKPMDPSNQDQPQQQLQSITKGMSRKEIEEIKQEEVQYNQIMRLQQQQRLDIIKSQHKSHVTVIDEHELINYMTKKLSIEEGDEDNSSKLPFKNGKSLRKTNIPLPQRNQILKQYHAIELEFSRESNKVQNMYAKQRFTKQVYDNEMKRLGFKYKDAMKGLKVDISTISDLISEHRQDTILSAAHAVQKQEIRLLKQQQRDGEDSKPLTKHELHRRVTPTRTLVKLIIDATKPSKSLKSTRNGRQTFQHKKIQAPLPTDLQSPLGLPIEIPPQLNWWSFHEHPLSRSLRHQQDHLAKLTEEKTNPQSLHAATKSESVDPQIETDHTVGTLVPDGKTVINTTHGLVAYNPQFSALSDLELVSEYLQIQTNTVSRLHAALKPRATIVVVPPNTPFEALAMLYAAKHFKPGILHNSQDRTAKKQVQEAFHKQKINVLLCTDHSIHGMADLRADLVVSWGLPSTSQYISRSQLLSHSSTGVHVSIQESNSGVGGVDHLFKTKTNATPSEQPDKDDEAVLGSESTPVLETPEAEPVSEPSPTSQSSPTSESAATPVVSKLPKSTEISSIETTVPLKTQTILDEVRDLLGVSLERSFLVNGQLYPTIEETTVEYSKAVKDKHTHHYWDKYAGEGDDVDEDDTTLPHNGPNNNKGLNQGPGSDVVKFVRAKEFLYSPFPIQITRFSNTDRNESLIPDIGQVFTNPSVRESIQGDKDLFSTLRHEALQTMTPQQKKQYFAGDEAVQSRLLYQSLRLTHPEELAHLGLVPSDEDNLVSEPAQDDDHRQTVSTRKSPQRTSYNPTSSNTSSPGATSTEPDSTKSSLAAKKPMISMNPLKKKTSTQVPSSHQAPLSPFEQLLQQAVEMGEDQPDSNTSATHPLDDELDNASSGITKFQLSSVYKVRESTRSRFSSNGSSGTTVHDNDHDEFINQESIDPADLKALFDQDQTPIISSNDLQESDDEVESLPQVRVNPRLALKTTKQKAKDLVADNDNDFSEDVDFQFDFDDKERDVYQSYLTKRNIVQESSDDADKEPVEQSDGDDFIQPTPPAPVQKQKLHSKPKPKRRY